MEEMRSVKADMHNHLRTRRTIEGLFNPVMDRASYRLGNGGMLGVINFGDTHYEKLLEQKGYERVDFGIGFYVPGRDILVFKGQEVPTRGGHILVLGLEKDEHLTPDRTFDDTLKEAEDLGGLVGADHPGSPHHGIGNYVIRHKEKYLPRLKFWEVHNGAASIFPGANARSEEMFNCYVKDNYPHVAPVSFSDGHSLREIGTSWTSLSMPANYWGLRQETARKALVESLAVKQTDLNSLYLLSAFLTGKAITARDQDCRTNNAMMATTHIAAMFTVKAIHKLGNPEF